MDFATFIEMIFVMLAVISIGLFFSIKVFTNTSKKVHLSHLSGISIGKHYTKTQGHPANNISYVYNSKTGIVHFVNALFPFGEFNTQYETIKHELLINKAEFTEYNPDYEKVKFLLNNHHPHPPMLLFSFNSENKIIHVSAQKTTDNQLHIKYSI